MFKALRTIPVILEIIKDIQAICPDAFVINFTNPAGIIAEAVNRYTDFKRFISVCNVPIHTEFDLAKKFKVDRSALAIDFIGLNHLVFGTEVRVNGEVRTDDAIELIINDSATMKNIHDLPFEPDFLRAIGLILCPYHRY